MLAFCLMVEWMDLRWCIFPFAGFAAPKKMKNKISLQTLGTSGLLFKAHFWRFTFMHGFGRFTGSSDGSFFFCAFLVFFKSPPLALSPGIPSVPLVISMSLFA